MKITDKRKLAAGITAVNEFLPESIRRTAEPASILAALYSATPGSTTFENGVLTSTFVRGPITWAITRDEKDTMITAGIVCPVYPQDEERLADSILQATAALLQSVREAEAVLAQLVWAAGEGNDG